MTGNVEIVLDYWRTFDARQQKRGELRDGALYRTSLTQLP
jgi:hypothetical protein